MSGDGAAPNPFFTAHASAYAKSASHARGDDLGTLLAALASTPGQRAADIATGTGHTALALAAAGLSVIGLDPTPAMLAEARRLAAAQGLTAAVRWECADADHLPLPDASFDVVTCRRAFHHFPDPAHALGEMVRLLAPGGRLGVTDMCPTAETAATVHQLERLRDATHRTALTDAQWRALLAQANLTVCTWQVSEEPSTFAQWLAPIAIDGPEADAIRRALSTCSAEVLAALTGGRVDGWVKRRLIFVAERA